MSKNKVPIIFDIKVIEQQTLLALMMFFADCAEQGEEPEIEYHFRQGGEAFTHDAHFNVTSVYPPGMYLDLTVEKSSWISDIFDRYKPFLSRYFYEEDDEDDGYYKSTVYTFRLTDKLGKLTDLGNHK